MYIHIYVYIYIYIWIGSKSATGKSARLAVLSYITFATSYIYIYILHSCLLHFCHLTYILYLLHICLLHFCRIIFIHIYKNYILIYAYLRIQDKILIFIKDRCIIGTRNIKIIFMIVTSK